MADYAAPVVGHPPAAAPAARLTLASKLAFGAGELPASLTATVLAFFQLFFLTTVAGLSPAAAGAILLIVKIWDALNDPVIGWLSDRTRSRYGRRRPWILFGALPLAATFALQWVVPPLDGVGRFCYYLVTAMLFSLALTAVSIPYNALTPALSTGYDEGTSLTAFRSAFSLLASIAVGALHQPVVDRFADARAGYVAAAVLWSVCCVPPLLWCFLGTRERAQPTPAPAATFAAQLRAALGSRPFLVVMGLYLCSWLGVQITSAVLVFYLTYWFQRPGLIVPALLAVQLTAFVFLFVWSAASRRLGKRTVYVAGSTLLLVVQASLFFVPAERPDLALALIGLAGAGVAVAYLVPWSMMPDVVAHDELTSGERREGVFYGLMVFAQKLGLALGLFAVGLGLELQGFDQALAAGEQPATALLAIRLLVGPIPALVRVGGLALAAIYPISRARHAEMMAELETRRAAAARA